jgi:hypothetical protein
MQNVTSASILDALLLYMGKTVTLLSYSNANTLLSFIVFIWSIQCVPSAISSVIKPSRLESDQSITCSAKVKNAAAVPQIPYVFSEYCLIKNRDKFTFTYTLV